MKRRLFALVVAFSTQTATNSTAHSQTIVGEAIAAAKFLGAIYGAAKDFQANNGARFKSFKPGGPLWYANFTGQQVKFIANTAHCGPWNITAEARTSYEFIQCNSGHGDRSFSIKFNGRETFLETPGAIGFFTSTDGSIVMKPYDATQPPPTQ